MEAERAKHQYRVLSPGLTTCWPVSCALLLGGLISNKHMISNDHARMTNSATWAPRRASWMDKVTPILPISMSAGGITRECLGLSAYTEPSPGHAAAPGLRYAWDPSYLVAPVGFYAMMADLVARRAALAGLLLSVHGPGVDGFAFDVATRSYVEGNFWLLPRYSGAGAAYAQWLS